MRSGASARLVLGGDRVAAASGDEDALGAMADVEPALPSDADPLVPDALPGDGAVEPVVVPWLGDEGVEPLPCDPWDGGLVTSNAAVPLSFELHTTVLLFPALTCLVPAEAPTGYEWLGTASVDGTTACIDAWHVGPLPVASALPSDSAGVGASQKNWTV